MQNKLRSGIEKRITDWNKSFHALFSLLKSWSVLRVEREKNDETVTRPVAAYGEKFWTLNEGLLNGLPL